MDKPRPSRVLISMLKSHRFYIPSFGFLFFNLIFWLLLNSVAADNIHNMRISYGKESDYWSVWIEHLPWWMSWAIVAPIVIALVRQINHERELNLKFVMQNALIFCASMCLFWILTLIETLLLKKHFLADKQDFSVAAERLFAGALHQDILAYVAIASLGFAMSYYARSKEQMLKNQRLRNQLLKVELQSLKSQLSPHFLFNTLNTISGLIRLDHKDHAVRALSELSRMFRKVLENQKTQLTTLRNEIEFINSYLTIQKMRFENKLIVQMDVSQQSMEVLIPFMLLHTLVENAVQHGSQLESDENLLKLSVITQEQTLCIVLFNKIAQNENHHGFGIGLNNCKKRLQHIYGSNYTLYFHKTDDSHFETILILPTGGAHA